MSFKSNVLLLKVLFLLSLSSCEKSEFQEEWSGLNASTVGKGFFTYNYSVNEYFKSLKVYFYIPQNKTESTPVLFAFHGNNRNAEEYRDVLINLANSKNVIVIVPEFSESTFPGSNSYHLGNVYQNGEQPSNASLNPEHQWSFTIVETLFDYLKSELNNSSDEYYAVGHSAGAQFLHRFLMFKQYNRIHKCVISASGWYTFPDENVDFPYGIKNSILSNFDKQLFYQKRVFIQVGELDNNPNDPNVRRNSIVDLQGIHRLERAVNYYNYCMTQAQENQIEIHWELSLRPQENHNFSRAVKDAFNLLF